VCLDLPTETMRLRRDPLAALDALLAFRAAVQAAFARRLDRYDPPRPLRPWVLRLATNEALSWLRTRRHERGRVLAAEAFRDWRRDEGTADTGFGTAARVRAHRQGERRCRNR
jgi:DNA-directed RNA polymerase specialized sigma24 family protein